MVIKNLQHLFLGKNMRYNEENNITPKTVFKSKEDILKSSSILDIKSDAPQPYIEEVNQSSAADPVVQYMDKDQLQKSIENTRKRMQKAARQTDYLEAARLRDEMFGLQAIMDEKFPK